MKTSHDRPWPEIRINWGDNAVWVEGAARAKEDRATSQLHSTRSNQMQPFRLTTFTSIGRERRNLASSSKNKYIFYTRAHPFIYMYMYSHVW